MSSYFMINDISYIHASDWKFKKLYENKFDSDSNDLQSSLSIANMIDINQVSKEKMWIKLNYYN